LGLGAPIYGKLDGDLSLGSLAQCPSKCRRSGRALHAAAHQRRGQCREIRMGTTASRFFLLFLRTMGSAFWVALEPAADRLHFAVKPTSSDSLTPRRTVDPLRRRTEISTKDGYPCVGIRACRIGDA